jgi:subtilisin family serine protease
MTARSEPASPSERVLIFTVDSSRKDSARAASDVLQYVKSNQATTRLSPLRAKRGGYRDGNGPWEFDDPTDGAHLGNGTYILWAKSTNDTFELEKTLKHADPNAHVTASYRQRPASQRVSSPVAPVHPLASRPRHRNPAELVAAANTQRQWGLIRCGFPAVRQRLDTGSKHPSPGPIGMIDIGKRRRHPALDDSIVHCEPPTIGKPSIADHAGSVAAIIGARGNGMEGCCSADIVLYNVWTRNDGLDQRALYNALEEAIAAQLPVVNLSIWVEEDDPHLRALVAKCEKNNVVVVAAIGNSGNCGQRFYPAAYPGVIAVAATNAADDRQVDSTVGDWAFIAAPGEDILTVVGEQGFDRFSGTSFAAPCVSAAVWLAKRNNPTREPLTNCQIRWLLAQCVDMPDAGRNPEVGYGRLDVTKLEANLAALPSREECAKSCPPVEL